MVADGDVFVVREEGLVGAEELAYARGVVDGGVEVGVVGDVEGFEEGCASDGVQSSFCFFSVRRGRFEDGGKGAAEARPGTRPEGHKGVEGWGLAGGFQIGGNEAGFGAGVEIEEVGSDGDAEMRLAVE